jgi:chaperonin GroEL
VNVGAATETEMKEKKARIKDAHSAVKAALEEGIVPGGGVALARLAESVPKKGGDESDFASGYAILRQALSAPLRQIADNAGAQGAVVLKRVLDEKAFGMGYNAETGEYCDLVEGGIIDPAKVTRTALQNAVSVATMLLSTNCLVTDAPKKKDAEDEGGEGGMEGMDDM